MIYQPFVYRLSYVGWVGLESDPSETVIYDLIPRGVTFWSDSVHPLWVKKVCEIIRLISERTAANYATRFFLGTGLVGFSESDELFYRRKFIVKDGVIVDVGDANGKQEGYDAAKTPRVCLFDSGSIEQITESIAVGLNADVAVIALTQNTISADDKSAFVKAINEFSIRRQTLLLFETQEIKDEWWRAFENCDCMTNAVHCVMPNRLSKGGLV